MNIEMKSSNRKTAEKKYDESRKPEEAYLRADQRWETQGKKTSLLGSDAENNSFNAESLLFKKSKRRHIFSGRSTLLHSSRLHNIFRRML